jgi:hypothetical protein
MAIIGPDFMESGFYGGYDMDRVAGAEGCGFGKCARQQFDLPKDAIGYRN